jgi:pimeloyl-ACP methyl ester carboxylesterase
VQPNSSQGFALRRVACSHGDVAWREAGEGAALLLLHGIGSGSASWAGQFDGLAAKLRLIAWDAPGYGGSAALPQPLPLAQDYARALSEFVDRLGLGELVLVGHSLGAIIAAAWAAQPSTTLRSLVLASPARGYANATQAVREAKVRERVELVDRLGVAGMAAQRSAGLCAPGAAAQTIEQVRLNMARATPGGYAQAAYMLAHEDLLTHLRRVTAPVTVMCGELDTVTPPAACEQIARAIAAPFVRLTGVAHACYVEDPNQFNSALLACLNSESAAVHV